MLLIDRKHGERKACDGCHRVRVEIRPGESLCDGCRQTGALCLPGTGSRNCRATSRLLCAVRTLRNPATAARVLLHPAGEGETCHLRILYLISLNVIAPMRYRNPNRPIAA